MSGNYSRRKGNDYEVAVANWLTARGHPAVTSRNTRGGTQAGADIDAPSLPYAIEAKNSERPRLWQWWAQTEVQATGGQRPMLVIKRPGVGDVGESLAVITLADAIGHLNDGHLDLLGLELRACRDEIGRLRGDDQ